MSIGPTGFAGSAAASHLTQRHGSDIDKTQQDTAQQARQTQSEKKAEKSAGIGETEGDQAAGDRDADGQRLWEAPVDATSDESSEEPPVSRHSKDPDGNTGNQLDLEA